MKEITSELHGVACNIRNTDEPTFMEGVVCDFDNLDEKKFTILTSCDIVLIKLLSRPLGNASEDASICFTLFYCILQRENELLNLFIKT